MPTYTVEDPATFQEKELFLSYDEFMEWLKENSNWRQTFQPIRIAYNPPGVKGTGIKNSPAYSDTWREKLRGIKKSYRGSTINDNL